MIDFAQVIFVGLLILVLGLLSEYASPDTVKNFVLVAVILNAIVIASIMIYLNLK